MKAESGQNNNSRADMGAVAPGTTSAQRSSAGLPNLQSRWNLSLSSLGLHPASPANSPPKCQDNGGLEQQKWSRTFRQLKRKKQELPNSSADCTGRGSADFCQLPGSRHFWLCGLSVLYHSYFYNAKAAIDSTEMNGCGSFPITL